MMMSRTLPLGWLRANGKKRLTATHRVCAPTSTVMKWNEPKDLAGGHALCGVRIPMREELVRFMRDTGRPCRMCARLDPHGPNHGGANV